MNVVPQIIRTAQKTPSYGFSNYTIGGCFLSLSVFYGPVQKVREAFLLNKE